MAHGSSTAKVERTRDRDRRREIGAAGERAAAELLQARGCQILDRNWRCRQGELDLVVRDLRGTTRFIEVRSRTGTGYGTPAESVTATKLQRLRLLGNLWLHAHAGRYRVVAFDVVAVDLSDPTRPLLEIFEDVI